MKRVSVIVVAAGQGRRFGSPKQIALLNGKYVLDWSLETFESHEGVDEVILVLRKGDETKDYTRRYGKIVSFARGGARRQDSVLSGFRRIDPEKAGLVLVHDGARPLVSGELLSRIIEAVRKKGAVVPALPLEDTVKLVEEQEVMQTLEREKIYRCQTPQGFFYATLKEALDQAEKDNFYATDEAALVERLGQKVWIVPGEPRNIKITTPADIKIAEAFLED